MMEPKDKNKKIDKMIDDAVRETNKREANQSREKDDGHWGYKCPVTQAEIDALGGGYCST